MEIKLFHDIERGVKSALTKKRIVNYYMYNHFSTIPDLAMELDLSVPTVTKCVMKGTSLRMERWRPVKADLPLYTALIRKQGILSE